MNKHEKAAANRALLGHWLSLLESAFEKQKQKYDLLESGGGPISIPEIKLPPVSEDMKALILRGIERALDGDPDPFQLKPPRGKKPKLDRQGRIDLAYYIYRLVETEKKATVEEAIAQAAEKFSVSESTARDCYYELREWAKVLHSAYTRYRRQR